MNDRFLVNPTSRWRGLKVSNGSIAATGHARALL